MKRTKNKKNSLVDFCEACFPEVSGKKIPSNPFPNPDFYRKRLYNQ